MTAFQTTTTTITTFAECVRFDEAGLAAVAFLSRDADPRTTTIYDRRRENFDRHVGCGVVAFVANG